MWVQLLSPKNVGSENFESKKTFGQKNFGSKKLWSKKILGPKQFWVQKGKTIQSPNKSWVQKKVGPKYVGAKKMIQKNFGPK